MRKLYFLVIAAVVLALPMSVRAQVMDINSQTGSSQSIVGDGTNINVSSSSDTTTISLTGIIQPTGGGTGLDMTGVNPGSVLYWDGSAFAENNTFFNFDGSNLTVGSILGVNNNPLSIQAQGIGSSVSIYAANGTTGAPGGTMTMSAGSPSGDLYLSSGAGGDMGYPAGGIYIRAGNGSIGGSSGFVDIEGGNDSGSNDGSKLLLNGADAGSGGGGDGTLSGGQSFDEDGAGGNITVRGGSGGLGDFAKIKLGGSGYGSIQFYTAGDQNFTIQQGTSSTATLDFHSLTSNGTFTFPDATGTFSLLESDQTFSGINTFTNPVTNFVNSSNSTVHIGADGFPGCIVVGDSDSSGVTYITADNGVISASASPSANCN